MKHMRMFILLMFGILPLFLLLPMSVKSAVPSNQSLRVTTTPTPRPRVLPQGVYLIYQGRESRRELNPSSAAKWNRDTTWEITCHEKGPVSESEIEVLCTRKYSGDVPPNWVNPDTYSTYWNIFTGEHTRTSIPTLPNGTTDGTTVVIPFKGKDLVALVYKLFHTTKVEEDPRYTWECSHTHYREKTTDRLLRATWHCDAYFTGDYGGYRYERVKTSYRDGEETLVDTNLPLLTSEGNLLRFDLDYQGSDPASGNGDGNDQGSVTVQPGQSLVMYFYYKEGNSGEQYIIRVYPEWNRNNFILNSDDNEASYGEQAWEAGGKRFDAEKYTVPLKPGTYKVRALYNKGRTPPTWDNFTKLLGEYTIVVASPSPTESRPRQSPFHFRLFIRGADPLFPPTVYYQESLGNTRKIDPQWFCPPFLCTLDQFRYFYAEVESKGPCIYIWVEWHYPDAYTIQRIDSVGNCALPNPNWMSVPNYGNGADINVRILYSKNSSQGTVESVKLDGCCFVGLDCTCPPTKLWGKSCDCGCWLR